MAHLDSRSKRRPPIDSDEVVADETLNFYNRNLAVTPHIGICELIQETTPSTQSRRVKNIICSINDQPCNSKLGLNMLNNSMTYREQMSFSIANPDLSDNSDKNQDGGSDI